MITTEREHTDVSAGIFSPSALELYLTCPRLFYYNYVERLRPKKSAVAMSFGSAMHLALAEWRISHSLLEASAKLGIALADLPKLDPKRNVGTALTSLKLYHETFRHEPLDKWTYREIPFRIQMPNGTTLIGIVDAVSRREEMVELLDTKTTTSALSDFYFLNFQNSFALLSYDYACQQIYGRSDNVTVEGIHIPAEKQDHIQRKSIFFSDYQRKEYLNTYMRITSEIIQRMTLGKEAFYLNHSGCSRYGGCSMLPICTHGENHPAIVSEMIRESGGEKTTKEGK